MNKPYPLLLLILLLVSGCYPDEINSTEELDLVMTSYDETTIEAHNFKTYAMPDSVLHNDSNNDSEHKFDAAILNRIIKNMTSYGYTRINPHTTRPDVVILPEVITTENYQAGGCWDCWFWYDPWYPGWGWGYYPPSYVYSYSTGTILIAMVNQNDVDDQNEDSKAVWIGAVNGLLRNSLSQSRVEELIDQAFLQSPYLQTN
ncbi:DUF4136 domain-containing protein [Reichenbachiella agarivorans]|uniref:DUF4136 domain-containing protein n=1 Tax=Reichenbachiella agarivorans TaxID=2979464 RepID=A0ABY6CLG4_9BACT|nr:DUF4136 domain-containing protein [Reichenbachiella agarivorans]UXP31359.1 DUF4136 domain-containing protein [Reichenbachiella agarivorans]